MCVYSWLLLLAKSAGSVGKGIVRLEVGVFKPNLFPFPDLDETIVSCFLWIISYL